MKTRRIVTASATLFACTLVACVGDAPVVQDGGGADAGSDGGSRFCDKQAGAIFCADFDGAQFTEGFTLDCAATDGSVTREIVQTVSPPASASLFTKGFMVNAGMGRACTITAALPTTKRRLVVDVDVAVVEADQTISGQFLGVVDGARTVGLNAGLNNWVLSAGEPGTAQQKLAMYNALPPGTWVHLTLEIVRDTANGTASLALDGTPSGSVGGAQTSSSPSTAPTLRLGPRVLGNGMQVGQARFLYDNVVVRAMD